MNKFFVHILIIITYVISDKFADILKGLNADFLDRIDKTAQNINTDTIQYGLSYDNQTTVKVFIRLAEEGINNTVHFLGFLKSENEKKEYKLNCSNPDRETIICLSEPGLKLNTDDRFYVYYNRSQKEKIIFDYEDILEDDKRISLIFKPELYVNQTVYKDNKKVMAQINRKTVGEAYLYIVNKTKKVLNLPKDRFNKYIDLDHFVFTPDFEGFQNKKVVDTYQEALTRGYLFLEAEVQFTKDKVPVVTKEKQEDVSSKTAEELQIEKSKKLMPLKELLQMCREKNAIVELKFNYLDKNGEASNFEQYAENIMKEINDTNMFDSVFFNENLKHEMVLKLNDKKINNDLCLVISNIESEEKKKKIKGNYYWANRIIYEIDKDKISYDLAKYILSLDKRIKVSKVDNIKLADKLHSWGVNYISTNKIHPFLMENEKEEPFRVKCLNIFLDDLAECKMGPEIILRDNEFYNIHYSLNIYNKSEDINETAIGEFRFEDTKINDNKYYVVKVFNFKKGVIQLITSDKVKFGNELKGVIGPKHDNVAEIYKYNFSCYGSNQHIINCEIDKDSNKIEYDGEYEIYYLENYSFNEEEITDWGLMKLKAKHVYNRHEKFTYTTIIIFVSLVFLITSYSMQNRMSYSSRINTFSEYD